MGAVIGLPALGAFALWRYAHDLQTGTVVEPEMTESSRPLPASRFGSRATASVVMDLRRVPAAIAEWIEVRDEVDTIDALMSATADAACVVVIRGD
ncbi:hypothetical protein V6O07_18700, partial [Arthrospira platensis SPKY2]